MPEFSQYARLARLVRIRTQFCDFMLTYYLASALGFLQLTWRTDLW